MTNQLLEGNAGEVAMTRDAGEADARRSASRRQWRQTAFLVAGAIAVATLPLALRRPSTPATLVTRAALPERDTE